mmetsp:Transcript_68696/g.134956  ORF Transcript_68696/g.134956 Transcript_68696/m.134956 type:complete len:165 (+) Transcript_68696:328-822(+)
MPNAECRNQLLPKHHNLSRATQVRGSSATLRVGYQPYAHIVMVRQTVAIVSVRVERSKTKHHRLLDDEDDDEAGNKSDGDSGGLTGDEVEGGAAAARSAGEGDNGGLSGPMEALALEGGAGAGHSKAAAAAAAAASSWLVLQLFSNCGPPRPQTTRHRRTWRWE